MKEASPHPQLLWGGLAALAGLAMVTWLPHLPGDPFPAIAAVVLALSLVLRLRSGPLLFFGLWIVGELRPLLPNPRGFPWEGLPGSPEAGSTGLLAVVTVVYLFASCQFQFLCAGVDIGAREPFAPTLPGAGIAAGARRLLASIAGRVVGIAFVLALFEQVADWAGQTEVGYVFGEFARTGAIFWQAALAFVLGSIAVELARFLVLDRTSAACYLNDILWSAHRRAWEKVDRRLGRR